MKCINAKRLLSSLLLSSAALAPQVASAEASDPYDGMQVAVVYSTQGNSYSEDTKSKIVQTFVQAMNHGVLKASADDLYGRAQSEFPKRTMAGGPVSGFMRSMNYASKYIDAQYAATLGEAIRKDPNPGDWSFILETVVVPFEIGASPTIESKLVPPNLATMWDVAKGSFQEKVTADQAASMDRVTSTPVMNANDFPGGMGKAYRAGKDVLKKLNTDNNKFAFLPIYFRFLVHVSQQKMTMQINAIVKPGELNITDNALLNPDPNAMFRIEKIWSRPFGASSDTAMQVKIQRSWGGAVAENKPLAIATWGTLTPNDVRDVKRCTQDCPTYRRTHPNIMIKLTPSAYLFPKGATGTVSAISKYIVDTIDARQKSLVTMHIVFNQLVFDIEKMSLPTLGQMKLDRATALGLKSTKDLSKDEVAAIDLKYRTENNSVVASMSDLPIVIEMLQDAPDMSFLGAVTGLENGSGAIQYKYYTIGRNAVVDPDQAYKDDDDLLHAYWITQNKYKLYNAAIVGIYEKLAAPELAKQFDEQTKANLKTQVKKLDADTGAAVVGVFEPVTALFR